MKFSIVCLAVVVCSVVATVNAVSLPRHVDHIEKALPRSFSDVNGRSSSESGSKESGSGENGSGEGPRPTRPTTTRAPPTTRSPRPTTTRTPPTTRPPRSTTTRAPPTARPTTQATTEAPTTPVPTQKPTTPAPPTTSPPSGECDVVCRPGDHYLVNPVDCGSFYQCSNGVPIFQPCPDGLHFNPRLNVCDYPEDAGCIPSTCSRDVMLHFLIGSTWVSRPAKEMVSEKASLSI